VDEVTTIGLDIAKSVFQILPVGSGGMVVIRNCLSRREGKKFLPGLPPLSGTAEEVYWGSSDIQLLDDGQASSTSMPRYRTVPSILRLLSGGLVGTWPFCFRDRVECSSSATQRMGREQLLDLGQSGDPNTI
jgi:hypothetical protein